MTDTDTRSKALEELAGELGPRLARDEATRAAHRADTWMLSELLDIQGSPRPLPLAVVTAESTDDVAATLRWSRRHRIPVIPYGGGSGVCGGVEGRADAVVLSLRAMEGLVALDDGNLTARFRAGTLGCDAEQRVQQDGLTIGNWPQSIDLSTVGGWVATRASGQYSTAYGNIEDMVLALEAVLPDGSVLRTRETPRAAAGPDLRQLLLGSEGTLGVVTEVTFSLRPLPAASRGAAFHFPSLADGIEAIRRFMREGWRPPVVRLYDPRESRRNFPEHAPSERAFLILLHEGAESAVAAELEGVAAHCRACGGEAADAAAVDVWLERRNHVPTFRSLIEAGLVVDTIEVASTWDKVQPLYDAVTTSLEQVPNMLSATAHSSHSYRSGTNLYFTFVAKPERAEDMADVYRECWRRTMDACVEVGAGLAHHHGIGRIRREHLPAEIGASGVDLLRAVKRALDPDDLLNPGNLLPAEDA